MAFSPGVWKVDLMETRKIRELEILLPGEDADELERVDFVPAEKAVIAARRVTGDVWSRMRIIDGTVTRCWFINADMASSEFTGGTILDRCVLKGCTFIGAHLTEVVLKNVIFENCRFDYATLTLLRAAGPIAFVGCSFTETVFDRCKLSPAVFDGCKLNAPNFLTCDMRGADFRGNDLAKTIGVTTSFRGTVIGDDQILAFTEAVTRELELTVKPGMRP